MSVLKNLPTVSEARRTTIKILRDDFRVPLTEHQISTLKMCATLEQVDRCKKDILSVWLNRF